MWAEFSWYPDHAFQARHFQVTAQAREFGTIYQVRQVIPEEVLEGAAGLTWMSPWGIFFRMLENLMTGRGT